MSRPLTLALWLGIVLVAAFELFAVSLVLRPRVDPAYRAYYIDRTSDCWPHVTPASYAPGTTLSFIYGQGPDFAPNKICGWFYPSPFGAWSYGPYSLLRFVFPPVSDAMSLKMSAEAMVDAAHPAQRVTVSANGTTLGTLSFESTAAETRNITIPAGIAGTGAIDLRFDYPDARSGRELGPNEDPHLRAIRMIALTLG